MKPATRSTTNAKEHKRFHHNRYDRIPDSFEYLTDKKYYNETKEFRKLTKSKKAAVIHYWIDEFVKIYYPCKKCSTIKFKCNCARTELNKN